MTGSLAYRKHEAAILRGDVPEKYTRLLPHIPGKRILEIGAAEGVLALLLAKAGKDVTAIERSRERYEAAQALRDSWGMGIKGPRFICGEIQDRLFNLDFETLVAVRMIYYLGEHLDDVFGAVAKRIPNVVLCGNKNRAARWRDGSELKDTKADNYYASIEGMTDLLERHGYRIETVVTEGDPIVVGRA